MPRSAPASTLVIVVTGSVLLMTGCGSSGPSSNGEAAKSGPQVVKDAAAAFTASGATHFSGVVPDTTTKKPIKINLQLQSDGTSGTFAALGFPVRFVYVGGTAYLQAPTGFWVASKATTAEAAKLNNRWVKLPADSDLTSTLTLSSLAASLNKPDPGVTIEPKVTKGTFKGQKVVIVRESDGSQLYVAGTGKPYPLRIVSSAKSPAGAGDASFTNYGKHVTLKAPAGAIDATGTTTT